MKRSRICTGSRSVAPTAGLPSMRATIRLRRPALERRCHQAVEVVFIGGPRAVGDAGAARNGDQIRSGRTRRRLRSGDLVNPVVPHDHREILRRPLGDGGKATELHQQRAVAFERHDVPVWLCNRYTQRDRNGQAHAAQHVEILRPLAAGPQVEIGVADAADHRFVALELAHQPLGQLETVHHLRIVGADGSCRFHGHDALTPQILFRRSAAARG